MNYALGDTGAAFRLNVMGQNGGVDGQITSRDAWAVAPSLALSLDEHARYFLFACRTRQSARWRACPPSAWVSTMLRLLPSGANANVVPRRVDRDNFYGAFSDFDDVDANMFTARIEHDFADNVTLRNTSRYGKSKQAYVLTGVNTITATVDPGEWTVSRSRQSKHQENTLLTNRGNLTATFKTGSIEHSLTGGLEFIYEKRTSPGYTAPARWRRPGRQRGPNPGQPVQSNPRDPITGYALVRNGAYTRGDTLTTGAYIFDTIEVTPRWEFTGGIRVDDFYRTQFDSASLSQRRVPRCRLAPSCRPSWKASGTLFAYKGGCLVQTDTERQRLSRICDFATAPGGTNFTLSTASSGSAAVNNRIWIRSRQRIWSWAPSGTCATVH